MAVEIISESSKSNDYIKKLDLYMSCGIHEYWIVDPENEEIHIYLFEGNKLARRKTFTFKDQVKSFYFDDFSFTFSI